MLIALELAGFKSFADRTRFDFPDGITVVVGPNGSGKSNVVDAIKWVLGAQSAKALRGKDMIDVIFKGSSATGRKPCNSAEATLVFDNSGGHLPLETEEVQVTRRVYRSGEGEYLINGSACRLKDIKNLFRGTGVGVDAYSLIEQGKVDRMLQASPKDRRIIFEEAAGISRFNAKKAEAQRRLQRVDQNLTRLKDIVDEVHTRLNRLKNQASKAERFREMSSRLQQLRLRLGWTEYTGLQERSNHAAQRVDQLTSEIDEFDNTLSQAKDEAQRADLELHEVASKCQDVESRLQEYQQAIAVDRNQQTLLWQRIEESVDETRRQQGKLATLRARARAVATEAERFEVEECRAREAFEAISEQATQAIGIASQLRQELKDSGKVQDELRSQHVGLLRTISEKSASAAQQEKRLTDIEQTIESLKESLQANREDEQNARQAAKRAADRLKAIHAESDEYDSKLAAAQAELEANETQLKQTQERAAVLQGRLEGAGERLEILEQLETHLDGVDSGARHVLDLAQNNSDTAFRSIRGLVADLLKVEVEHAPQIDIALGHLANALVLDDGSLIQKIRSEQIDVPGRLSLMRLDRLPSRRYGEKVQLDGVQGVFGRADRLIQCEAPFEPLFTYLLGTTWLVESLDIALDLSHFRGANLRFVTSKCELVDSDGTLTVGALQSSAGLVSRKSEIASARQEIDDCKAEYQKTQGDVARLVEQAERLRPSVTALRQDARKLAQEFAHQQATAQNAIGRLDEIETRGAKLLEQLESANQEHVKVQPTIQDLLKAVDDSRSQLSEVEDALGEHDEKVRKVSAELVDASEAETTAKVELARSEEKYESASTALSQVLESKRERLQAVAEVQQETERICKRRQQAELEILTLSSRLAEHFINSEREEAKLEVLAGEAAVLRKNRTKAMKHLDSVSRSLDKLQASLETSQAELERCQESTQLLLKRYAEDYEISFEALSEAEKIEDDEELEAMSAEASGLRQDISAVGEINMSALAELDELQQRYDHLNGQYEDLVAAKESLQRIIHKINADSRKMFLETLEIIRTNFQKLYRKSFGGGSADIVLEEGEDVLECGIDIIATPPGKTALSNSLLSGGEKALTAVALLLAIFQYRPSPFCVLDEVDAPFDEANIGRFVNVLTEFLDWTKFIIVTHSKKTMTASTTLYGVTMQESGVSKQVAVRFEDVNEKGEIIDPNKPKRAAA